jgi:hypothetical protein
VSDCEAAIGTDEVAREVAFGILLEHEVAGVGCVYARRDRQSTAVFDAEIENEPQNYPVFVPTYRRLSGSPLTDLYGE